MDPWEPALVQSRTLSAVQLNELKQALKGAQSLNISTYQEGARLHIAIEGKDPQGCCFRRGYGLPLVGVSAASSRAQQVNALGALLQSNVPTADSCWELIFQDLPSDFTRRVLQSFHTKRISTLRLFQCDNFLDSIGDASKVKGTFQHLKTLRLRSCKLSDSTQSRLPQILSQANSLVEVDLENVALNPTGFFHMVRFLAANPKLRLLRIIQCLQHQDIHQIALLASFVIAKHVELSRVVLDGLDGPKLGALLRELATHRQTPLQCLDLTYNEIDTSGSQALSRFIGSNNIVRSISLSDLDDESALALFDGLDGQPSPFLEKLEIFGAVFDTAAVSLGARLKKNEAIQEISFESSEQGLVAILGGLENNKSVVKACLMVSENTPCGVITYSALGRFISGNETMQDFELYHDGPMSLAMARELATLGQNTSLRRFILVPNDAFQDDGAPEVYVEALKSNMSVMTAHTHGLTLEQKRKFDIRLRRNRLCAVRQHQVLVGTNDHSMEASAVIQLDAFPDVESRSVYKSLDGYTIERVASFLEGGSLLNWVKASRWERGTLVTPSLFVRNAVHNHTKCPIDTQFIDSDALPDQDELRCELLRRLTMRNSDVPDDFVVDLAKWLEIDANSMYAKQMAVFIHSLVSRYWKANDGFYPVDVVAAFSSLGFRSLPTIPAFPCWRKRTDGNFEEKPLTLVDMMADMRVTGRWSDESTDLYPLPPLIETVKLAKELIAEDVQNETTVKGVAKALFQDDAIEELQASGDVEAWYDSIEGRMCTCQSEDHTLECKERFLECLGKSRKMYAADELEDYKQAIFRLLDTISEADAGLVEPNLRLPVSGFKKVFALTRGPGLEIGLWRLSYSRSTMNILQHVIETIHFGSLCQFHVQIESPLGPERLDGILLLADNGISALACEKVTVDVADELESLSLVVDDDDDEDDSDYLPSDFDEEEDSE